MNPAALALQHWSRINPELDGSTSASTPAVFADISPPRPLNSAMLIRNLKVSDFPLGSSTGMKHLDCARDAPTLSPLVRPPTGTSPVFQAERMTANL